MAGPAALFRARTESSSCSRTSRTTIDIRRDSMVPDRRGVCHRRGDYRTPPATSATGRILAGIARGITFGRLGAPPEWLAWVHACPPQPLPAPALCRPFHLGGG